jgi:uncharacterized protein
VTGGRPQPVRGPDSDFFWRAAAQGRLVAQLCQSCGQIRHPPQPMCPHCRSFDWSERTLSGRGTIYSYTIHEHPPLPGMQLPVHIALVELAEKIRMVGQLVDVPAGRHPRIGDQCTVRFLSMGETSLPVWTIDALGPVPPGSSETS